MNDLEPSVPAQDSDPDPSLLIERDELVEEVSIDGMCGVY